MPANAPKAEASDSWGEGVSLHLAGEPLDGWFQRFEMFFLLIFRENKIIVIDLVFVGKGKVKKKDD